MFPRREKALHSQLNIPYPTSVAPTYFFISQSQYEVFRIAHFVAPLSILGSLAIISRITIIDRNAPDAGGRRTYHRLLVAMSICDVFGSLAFSFGASPIPKETLLSDAKGTAATCAVQGFVIHWFVVAVLYYNTGLMIYFVLTIRYGWTEARAAKWLEPVIHAWALLVPLAQAVTGLVLDILNPVGLGNFCFIGSYPPLCDIFINACTRGRHAKLLYTLFCVVPACFLFAVIYISIPLIYCTVRSQSRRALSITANQERVRAKVKAVAVQSWLFAIFFFITWVFAVLEPLTEIAIKQTTKLVRAQYISSVLVSTLLPLQGFFNFCIYIRPRFLRLKAERQLPKPCSWLSLADTHSSSGRRSSTIMTMQHPRRGSTLSKMAPPVFTVKQEVSAVHLTDGEGQHIKSPSDGITENEASHECAEVEPYEEPEEGA